MVVENQSRFFINIFIFACFRIFHQTHDSTLLWMSPKFSLVTPVGPVKAFFAISPFQYRSNTGFVQGIIFFVKVSANFTTSSGLSKTPVPFCFFKPTLTFV